MKYSNKTQIKYKKMRKNFQLKIRLNYSNNRISEGVSRLYPLLQSHSLKGRNQQRMATQYETDYTISTQSPTRTQLLCFQPITPIQGF